MTTWCKTPPGRELLPEEIHVWRIQIHREPHVVEERAALLSEDERERMARFRFDLHRERFAIRRGAMRILLGRYLGVDPRRVQFRVSAHGKPEAVQPAGKRSLRFNLSDSEDLALLAVNWDAAIGVDVERIRPMPEMDRIAREHFSPSEYTELQSLSQELRTRGFYNCWTRKEAWLKARGEGLIGDLAGFDVSLAPGRTPHLRQVRDAPEESARWRLFTCAPLRGYVGAVAVQREQSRLVRLSF